MAIERLFTPVIAVIEIAAAGNTLFFSGPFPRSISWQRLLQNGRQVLSSSQITCLPQVGQLTTVTSFMIPTLTTSQLKIEAGRDFASFTVQRQKTDGITTLMAGDLRI